jgi:hypothetical protein
LQGLPKVQYFLNNYILKNKKFFDRIYRIKRSIKRRLFLFWPNAKTKGYHLIRNKKSARRQAMASAWAGFRPAHAYPANPVNPVKKFSLLFRFSDL